MRIAYDYGMEGMIHKYHGQKTNALNSFLIGVFVSVIFTFLFLTYILPFIQHVL